VARRASVHLRKLAAVRGLTFAPQLEFFIFDQACYEQGLNHARYRVDSREGAWRRGQDEPDNVGYQVPPRGGLHALPPADSLHNTRCEIVQLLEQSGIEVESHHHGPATGGQAAIRLRSAPLLETADRILLAKYIVRNAAARHGKTATFMPQPLFGDCGSGMPTVLGFAKGDLAEAAEGGVRRRLASLLALCCPTTNSFRRLAAMQQDSDVGDRAPVRVLAADATAARMLVEAIDGTCNPYLALSALALAAAQSTPKKAARSSTAKERRADGNATHVPRSLGAALDALESDHEFLVEGSAFDADALRAWIQWKRLREVEAVEAHPHPYEFCLYFDL
jgi:glutamine synthetase